MAYADELSNAFYQWERRLRGWDVYPEKVVLEPPLVPLTAYLEPSRPVVDDGRQHTVLSAAVEGFASWLGDKQAPAQQEVFVDEEFSDEPGYFSIPDENHCSYRVALPADYTGHLKTYKNLLQSLRYAQNPLSFEIVGNKDQICVQLSAWQRDSETLVQQLRAHLPEATVTEGGDAIDPDTFSDQTFVVDFGLEHGVHYPLSQLSDLKHDPLTAIVGAMEELTGKEQCIFQILFTHTNENWNTTLRDSVIATDGSALFADGQDLVRHANDKTRSPLYACVLRLCVIAEDEPRRWELARAIGGAIAQYDAPAVNNLMPLSNEYNEGYGPYDHYQDVVGRTTHRSGMILSLDELVGFLHYPDAVVRSDKLVRQRSKTKAAPKLAQGNSLILGENTHRNQICTVSLTSEQRLRHMYLVGASGTGKSTMLLNMIIQDMQNGQGVAVLDPHGDLIDTLLQYVPDERIDDVIVFDPSDEEYPIGFNIIDAHSELEKVLLASDLTSVFKRLSTSWGDQMNSVLANGISAMLESDQGGTLPTLRRFLVDKAYRNDYLKTVNDPENVFYWEREFPLLTGKPQGPVLTRLDTFLRPKPIRHMVAQKENKIDFSTIMQKNKIFLAKLSQGAIGTENSYLMGAFLVTKLNQIAYSRQALSEKQRNNFYLYIDEFHNFITPSMESILSGARKYKMGLVLAHQELRQLEGKDQDVASSVISNPYTRVCFRLGDNDAKKLQNGFTMFEAQDLQSLGIGEAIARVEQSEYDFNLKTPPLPEIDQPQAEEKARAIIKTSQQKYGTPKEEVEDLIYESLGTIRPKKQNTNKKESKPLPGRGGQTHKEIQQKIKQLGEKAGFKATIEKRLKNGSGHVDVALDREGLSIACEVAVHSTVEQELGNIGKCLDAGFDKVICVSPSSDFLRSFKNNCETTFERIERYQLSFVNDEDFPIMLKKLTSDLNSEIRFFGYDVKVEYIDDE